VSPRCRTGQRTCGSWVRAVQRVSSECSIRRLGRLSERLALAPSGIRAGRSRPIRYVTQPALWARARAALERGSGRPSRRQPGRRAPRTHTPQPVQITESGAFGAVVARRQNAGSVCGLAWRPMFCPRSSRAFWRARSGRRCELDAAAARDPSTDSRDGLGTVFGCRPYVGHQRLERPEPQVIGALPAHLVEQPGIDTTAPCTATGRRSHRRQARRPTAARCAGWTIRPRRPGASAARQGLGGRRRWFLSTPRRKRGDDTARRRFRRGPRGARRRTGGGFQS
jgi:hypothetical protein